MKTATLTAIFFFVSASIFAQINFKDAYIITNSGDTIVGYVDLRTDKQLAVSCLFARDNKSEKKTYFPGDIAEFRFIKEGKKYISREIDIDGKTHNVFLEYLVQGMMNLYCYSDESARLEHYFFEDEQGKMISITKHPSYINDDSRYVEDNRYKGVLNYLFQDMKDVLPNQNKMEFNRQTMVEIVKDYHHKVCTTGEECIEFENDYKKKFTILKISVFAGLSYYSYNHKAQSVYKDNCLSPVIGATMNIKNPRWSNSFSFQLETSISQLRVGTEIELLKPSKYYFEGRKNKAMIWNLNLGPKYTYPKGKIRPTVEAGVGYTLLFAKSSKAVLLDDADTKPMPAKLYDDMRSSFLVVSGGVGVDVHLQKDNYITLRGTYSWSQAKSMYFSDRINTFSVKLGYTF